MASEGRVIRVCPECGQPSKEAVCPQHQRVLLPPNRRARLASAPLLGYVLDERYVLVDRIGGGGMSVVYAALQRPLGRLVAVKVLHAQLTATKSARDRFEREARTVSLLKSRNTVTLFDFGVSRAGAMPSVAYMVMEYVAGESLATRLKRVGALPPSDVARIVRDMGRSLHEAHQKGIVHRDMKPANVILTTTGDEDDGEPGASFSGGVAGTTELAKVIDFGIARLEDTAMTQTGMLLGTPNYMAPELFEGGREVDPRADVYALGVMIFQMLAGQRPFKDEGGPLGVLWHHANSPVPPLPGSASDPRLRAIDGVIRKAMGKHPDDRYPTVRALVEAFLVGMGVGEGKLDDDVIELSIEDIEISPEVRSLTSQYQMDLDPGLADGPATAPTAPLPPPRTPSRRPGAALDERDTVPRSDPLRVASGPRASDSAGAEARPLGGPVPAESRRAPGAVAQQSDRTRPRSLPVPQPEPVVGRAPDVRGGRLPEPLSRAFGELPSPAVSGPTALGRVPPEPASRFEDRFDDVSVTDDRPAGRGKSHGYQGLVVLVVLVVLAGAAALYLLDQRKKGAPTVAAPETVVAAPRTTAPETAVAAAESRAPESVPAAPETVAAAPETVAAAPETVVAAPETITAAPETVAEAPATLEVVAAVAIAPETDRAPDPHRVTPRTAAGPGRIETASAAVRTALAGGDCSQARRHFRALDELPGSGAAVAALAPALAACRPGSAAAEAPASVKVVVAPSAEDHPSGGGKPARLVAGSPSVQGGLAAGDVNAALRRLLSTAPLGCVGKHNLKVEAPAELRVALRVTAAGQLIDAALARSTVGNPAFERCVVNSLRSLQFPASADASRIELPLKVVAAE